MKPSFVALPLSLLWACACPQTPPAPAPAPPPAPTTAEAAAPNVATDAGPHGPHHRHHGDHSHGPPSEGDGRAPLVHRFDETDPETWARRFESKERDAYQQPDKVVAALALTPGMQVADIGTGTGYFVPRLSEAVGSEGRVHAVDIAPNMVRYVKERAKREGLSNVEVHLALLDDPLLANDSLDRVLIVNTWHHIPDREAYSKRLAAALRPGGAVFIVDFKRSSDRGPKKEHKLAPEQVAEELRAGGLAPRVDTDLLGEQFIVRGDKPSS